MPDRRLRLRTRPWVRSQQDAGATKWLPVVWTGSAQGFLSCRSDI